MNHQLDDVTSSSSIDYLEAQLSSLQKAIKNSEDIVRIEADVKKELAMWEGELTRRQYLEDPELWVDRRLDESLWSIQAAIMKAVASTRRVAVPSCFGSGKSFTAARLAAWWIDCHPKGTAFVVTTATTGAQVKAILWREIHRAHDKGKLAGRVNQTEWWLNIGQREEMVAFGRKPGDMDPAAFQGIHARYVLVVLDEAAGIPEILFNAADGLIVNKESRILAIGNPEDAESHFAQICKPGSGWKVIQIPAFITPNFTDESVDEGIKHSLISQIWVDEKRKTWGEKSPMWEAKVEANFPSTQEDGLIPIAWVRAAQARNLAPVGENELGVDVGAGGDKSTIYQRRGPVVRLIKRDSEPDTMKTCGNVIAALVDTRATIAKIDEIGIGRGVVDRAKEQGKPVVGINVSAEPTDKIPKRLLKFKKQKDQQDTMFANLRAEGYWHLRELFQSGDIDIPEEGPEAEELAAQLVAIKYKRTSAGKIQIESKKEMKARGVASPDDADGVMLAFLKNLPKKKKKGAVWGK